MYSRSIRFLLMILETQAALCLSHHYHHYDRIMIIQLTILHAKVQGQPVARNSR
ncbi:hypothetical protein ASPBRDRAFT_665764 [Aspergillus brasiliensis CBS 101740]|uniref:Uncharacterized protein n=1 Tax=Aspergillus brasiliensis (strain CBS 101740 / IMI 381727 / IBT 21946) TaxID=767769 RepID=A0A1L9U4N6_ASPBC|nr:hypothetical protein ASPBRDRAFT_665764 [Aspergillus brasiliensis CBS 101740]